MKNLISGLFGLRSTAKKNAVAKSGFPASRAAPDNPATIEDGSDNAMRRQLVSVLVRDVLRRHGIPAGWVECQMLVVSSRSRGSGMYIRLVATHWDQRLMNYAFAFQKSLVADIVRFEPQAAQWLHGISWQFEFAATCPYLELPDKSFWQAPAPVTEPAAVSPALHATPGTATLTAASSTSATSSAAQPTLAELAAAAARQANAARRAALGRSEASGGSDNALTVPAALGQQASAPNPSTNRSTDDLAQSDAAQDLERLFAIRDRELGQSSGTGPAEAGYEKTLPSPL